MGSNPVTPTKKKKQADTPVFFFVVVLGIMNEILFAKFQFTNQRVALVPKETHIARFRPPVIYNFLFTLCAAMQGSVSDCPPVTPTIFSAVCTKNQSISQASVASILPDFYHSASSLSKRPIKACFSVAFLLFAKMLFFDFCDSNFEG